MHYFYTPDLNQTEKKILVTDKNEIHHIKNVLRLKKDNLLELFNGKHLKGRGVIVKITNDVIEIEINKTWQEESRLPVLILACAIPKKGKFETIIEKATELGVNEIIPLQTTRSDIKFKQDQIQKKILRFSTVALNASKQSKRATIPIIHSVTAFPEALNLLTKRSTVFIPSLESPRENILSAFQNIPATDTLSFLIGPEGDFTTQEYADARSNGCIPVSLGETILKVETAAICAIACARQFFC